MKTLIGTIGLASVLVLLTGCSSVSYVTDWDTQKDYSNFQSFAWYELAATPDRGSPTAVPNAIVSDRIRRSVESSLTRKGMNDAGAAEADLLVTYHVVLRHGYRVYNSGWGYPYYGWGRGGWGWGGAGWGGGYSSVRTVTEGTLIIDVLDASKRRLIWRGIADGAFKKPNPTDEYVGKVVDRLFQSFPPR